LEAVTTVIGLADTKRVLLSEIGLKARVRNAATTVTTGTLRLLFRLSLLLLLRVFLLLLGVLVLLRRSFFLLLCVLTLLRSGFGCVFFSSC
jgi:flagellar biosynthesis protein FliP